MSAKEELDKIKKLVRGLISERENPVPDFTLQAHYWSQLKEMVKR